MMIFNPKKPIPMVDSGTVVHSDRANNPQDRARLRENEVLKRRHLERIHLMRQAENKRIEHENDVRAQKNAAMYKRSLKQGTKEKQLAGARHSFGYVPTYGVNNALMGFVDETPYADYEQRQVIPAQEFNNALSSKDFADYTKFKDYPLVLDAPAGDFGGVLTNEKGSPDFSQFIVDDVQQDFGAIPRRAPRR